MRAVICLNLHILLLPFLCISATLSLGSDGRSGISDSNFISVQFDAATYTIFQHRKEKMG